MNSLFKKLFLGTLFFTIGSWAMAWVFSAAAGETPKITIAKLESRLSHGQKVEEREVLDLKGIQKISVMTKASDLVIQPTSGDVAIAEFSGSAQTGQKVIALKREGNELQIRVEPVHSGRGFEWHLGNLDIDEDSDDLAIPFNGLRLQLPAEIIKTLELSAHSGDISVRDLNFDNLKISTLSGEVEIDSCSAKQQGSVETTTGDIEVDGFTGNLKTVSTTGEIEVSNLRGEEFKSVSTTGDLEIQDVDLRSLRAQSTTGDISVALKDGAGWKFSFNRVSGDVANEFKDDINAQKIMQIETTSGDIRVHR